VLTNPQTKDKKSLRCNAIIAKCSIVDPQVMMTMPKELLACVGFDALCHNMEAYLSKYSQPFVQIYALEAIRLIGETLVSLYHNSQNNQGWEKLTLASLLGGMVINMAGVTAAHGLEHPVSGLKDIVHGKGLAALTPFILEETIASAPEKCAAIAGCLGGKAASELPGLIRKLLFDLNLATTLGELGIVPGDVDWMAENCLKISKASLDNHPRQYGLEELKRLYTKAL
jgi:alcohol dehydrogenase class IV